MHPLQTTHYKLKARKGFSLIEILIAATIFLIVIGGIIFSYANILEIMSRTRDRSLVVTLLEREVEIIRSLDYENIGIQGGYPPGVIQQGREIYYEGKNFTIEAFVRNIDDPFDGTTGGDPNDTAPADYKLVQLRATCSNCLYAGADEVIAWVSPEGLETETGNGSLFINVFDANGLPIEDADITVENDALNLTIIDETNASGTLQLVDIPTSTNAYAICVSKDGYSSAQTYLLGDEANPNPVQPHATVASGDITEISFAIDKVSSINVQTYSNSFCSPQAGTDFIQSGTKLIGSGPDVLKYEASFYTDGDGQSTRSNLEWDNYSFILDEVSTVIAGSNPFLPVELAPDADLDLAIHIFPATTTSLLVAVADEGGEPIPDAEVSILKGGDTATQTTALAQFSQTDWSGSDYDSQDGGLVASEGIELAGAPDTYPTGTTSWLISRTFDLGTASTTFREILINPESQPSGTILKIQVATNNDNTTWSFVGPDGTSSTYYANSGQLSGDHNGDQYLRYKAYLSTTNSGNTPTLEDISFSLLSGCAPQGYAYFANPGAGTWEISASKTGYATATSSIDIINGPYQDNLILIAQ